MNSTNNIINIALLGTAGKEVMPGDVPTLLQPSVQQIKAGNADTEDVFYKSAAMVFACCRSGIEPLRLEEATFLPESPDEEKKYTGVQTARLLITLLQNRLFHLLRYGYGCIAGTGKLIPPVFLPGLLSHAFEPTNSFAYQEKKLLSSLIGQRGNWYLQLSGKQLLEEEKELPWETSTHAQRKGLLRDIRSRNPGQALELLQSEWKNESAQHRAELLECLEVNLSPDDESFITGIRETDRSSTVKDIGLKLLLKLPGSAIIRSFCSLLKEQLRYRMILGWSVGKITYTDELKKNGILEMSRNKNESDSDYILRQLAEAVPLSFWCELLNCNEKDACLQLRKNPPFAKHISFTNTILNYNDCTWAYYHTKDQAKIDFRLIPLLTVAQRESLAFEKEEYNYLNNDWFGNRDERWGEKFSRLTLNMVFNVKSFYQNNENAELLAIYMPPVMKDHLRQLSSTYENDPGRKEYCEKILYYMEIKDELQKL